MLQSQIVPLILSQIRCCLCTNTDKLTSLCQYLQIDKTELKHFQKKSRKISEIDVPTLEGYKNVLNDLGFPRDSLLKCPQLYKVSPRKIKFRYTILQECGVEDISTERILSYFKILRTTIGDLKASEVIPRSLNVEHKLANVISKTPNALTPLVYDDVNNQTMYTLRIKVIQKFLELEFNLNENEFMKALRLYRNIKYSSLQSISDVLSILKMEFLFSNDRIKQHLYLLHANPSNLKEILNNFEDIFGRSIKEIIMKDPSIALRNYSTLCEIRQILRDFNVNLEQPCNNSRLFHLNPKRVRERLEKVKETPDLLNNLSNNQEFLLYILNYKKKVLKFDAKFIKKQAKHFLKLK